MTQSRINLVEDKKKLEKQGKSWEMQRAAEQRKPGNREKL